MQDIHECKRDDGVKIHNHWKQGDPLSVMIPAELIWRLDYLLREMTHRGATSAPLEVHYEGLKEFGWVATFGAFSCGGSTPWDALSKLGKAMEDFKREA